MKVENTFEVHLIMKNSRGEVSLFSEAPRSSSVKPPWGQVLGVSLVSDFNKSGQLCEYFKISNGTEEKLFKVDSLNTTLGGMTTFGQAVTNMKIETGPKSLADYLDHLVRHGGIGFTFGQYNADEELNVNLAEHGGNKNTLEQFSKKARDSATLVVNSNKHDALRRMGGKTKIKLRRVLEEVNENSLVPTKKEKIEESFVTEVVDHDGIEKQYVGSLVARRELKMKYLSVSPDHPLPVSQVKVDKLVQSMRERLDRSLLVFVVFPVEQGSFDRENKEDYDKQPYFVVSGVHRLLALKKLSNFGPQSSLTCYILFNGPSGDSAPLKMYAGVRNNELASTCTRKPYVQELLLIMVALSDSMGVEAAQKTVDRFAILMRLPETDRLTLAKYSKFNSDNLKIMAKIIKNYEVFNTKDALEVKNKKNLIADKLEIPKSLFKAISMVDQDLFSQEAPGVLAQKTSLKELGKKSDNHKKKRNTETKISKWTGFKSIESLRKEFPNKFEEGILEHFMEAGKGGKDNIAERSLKSYIANVTMRTNREDVDQSKSALTREATNVCSQEIVIADLTPLDIGQPDSIVVNVNNPESKMVKLALERNPHNILILTKDEEKLDSLKQNVESLVVNSPVNKLYFEERKKNLPQSGQVIENIRYGLLVGHLYNPPTDIVQGDLKRCLPKLVQKMTPPLGEVVLLNDVGLAIPQIHLVSSEEYQVVYKAEKDMLSNFFSNAEVKVVGEKDPFEFEDEMLPKETDDQDDSEYYQPTPQLTPPRRKKYSRGVKVSGTGQSDSGINVTDVTDSVASGSEIDEVIPKETDDQEEESEYYPPTPQLIATREKLTKVPKNSELFNCDPNENVTVVVDKVDSEEKSEDFSENLLSV